MSARNAFYAQSGGVTAVINATACGLIQEARRFPERIGKVYAGRDGIIGALTEDLIDTSLESDADIARLRHTPGGAFGSCRYKLKSLAQHQAQYERLIDVFKAHDIGYFFYNGGNDSMDTAWKVSQIAEKRSEEHTSELQSHHDIVCRLLLEKKKKKNKKPKKKATDKTRHFKKRKQY